MGVSLMAVFLVLPAYARSSTDLKIMIFPLECSIDLLNTGVTTLRQITPENCQDPDEEPSAPGDIGGAVESPVLSPPLLPRQNNTLQMDSLAAPLEQIPVTTLPVSPEVNQSVVSERVRDHATINLESAGGMQTLMFGIAAITVLALMYGILHLLASRLNRP
jgi:hypothetical protein